MKRTAITLVALLASAGTASAAPIFNTSNDHYYEYVAAPDISWFDARDQAQTYMLTDGGGNTYAGFLAVPDDSAENAFLGTVTGANYVWLGLSDEAEEGVWRIVTGPDAGSLATYLPWASGEPNDVQYANINGVRNGEHYAERYTTGYWNDLPYKFVNRTTGYFVEFTTSGVVVDPVVTKVPAPATGALALLGLLGLTRRRRR